jgi:ABC-type glutathione transport system ATPase component
MAPIIEAQGFTKSFGEVRALDGLDLVAHSGSVTALLGPNGAGKTTFVSAVATLLRPDSGEVRVAGIDAIADPKRVREIIGLAGQFASVEPAMTGTENLRMVARLFGLSGREARTAAAAVLCARTRVGCGVVWTLAQAWWAGPNCCCSMSQPAASTHAVGSTSGRRSATWSPTARMCFSLPSTSRKPISWRAWS